VALPGKWERDFHTLRHDVHGLFVRREIFKALDDELALSGREGTAIICDHFLRPIYVESHVITIRRLADPARGGVSFYRLLTDMAAATHLLGASNTVDRKTLLSYRTDIQDDAKRVKAYVDKHVADRDRLASSPLYWGELNKAIGRIGHHLADVSIPLLGTHWAAEVALSPVWRDVFAPGLFFASPLATWLERQERMGPYGNRSFS
jgi:hypothetical protein